MHRLTLRNESMPSNWMLMKVVCLEVVIIFTCQMLGSEYASFLNILFEIWLIFKNCTYLLYTVWWVWTYAYLSETITIIRVIYRSITSTSFLVTLFLRLGGIASRAEQGLSSFSSGSVMARESLSRVCFLLLSSCLSCGTHWVRSELPGWPPLQMPSPCCAPPTRPGLWSHPCPLQPPKWSAAV